jgi:hypothetical protein
MTDIGAVIQDIYALVDEAERQLTKLRAEYEACLQLHEIRPRMRVLIKNILENERSALDHLARLLVDEYGKDSDVVYYPLAWEEATFGAVMDSKMPGVASALREVAEVIAKFQPYRIDCKWLANLCNLVNENKHERLSAQTRQQQHRREVHGTGGTVVSWDPGAVTFGGGPGTEILINGEVVNPATQRTANTIDVVYVAWQFDELQQPVLAVLTEIQENLPVAVSEIVDAAFD